MHRQVVLAGQGGGLDAAQTAEDCGSTKSAEDCRTTVGPYLLIEEIDRGGMGVVFKARHSHLERLVALKIIAQVNWRAE